ncbi:MAG TPA: glycosyltransferase family 1 protein, partial [Aggregatilineales bacterium]|nr:glycosyltransferase family 1 protein [Aggregatilineales bacterium]
MRYTLQMRIGIDARLTGYRAGGIARYTEELIRALAELDSANDYRILQTARPRIPSFAQPLSPTNTRGQGSQTSLEVPPPHKGEGFWVRETSPNFRPARIFTPPHNRLERLALSVEIARLRLDVLHSPDFIPPRFGARRRVITIHDLNFLYFPQFQTPDSLQYYAGHIRAAVREADHILAVSQSAADDLCNLLSVPPHKITIQAEGVTPDYHPMGTEEIKAARLRLGLPQNYLLFVGTLEPRKNVIGLLDAYARLCQQHPDAPPLVIAGQRGWLYEDIFKRALALPTRIQSRLHWIENFAPADLPSVYNGAMALVLPSFYEGFGLPPLEAMACGIPTVVSNRGSLPEIVGDAGLLIDPDSVDSLCEALARVLSDRS